MEKRISAIQKDDKIYLGPSGRTDDWLWVELDPILVFSVSASNDDLGNGFIETLNNSKMDVPTPSREELKGPGKMASLAGYKSWPSFAKNSLSVGISSREGKVEFGPSIWKGVREGHAHNEQANFSIPVECSPKEFAVALRKAFDLCK